VCVGRVDGVEGRTQSIRTARQRGMPLRQSVLVRDSSEYLSRVRFVKCGAHVPERFGGESAQRDLTIGNQGHLARLRAEVFDMALRHRWISSPLRGSVRPLARIDMPRYVNSAVPHRNNASRDVSTEMAHGPTTAR
jgi:hypothetical protein